MVRRSTFRKLLSARSGDGVSVIFPTLNGARKHSPLVYARMIPEILAVQSDGGLRQLWQRHENLIQTVSIDDEGGWIDLDTRQDYQSCKQGYKFVK